MPSLFARFVLGLAAAAGISGAGLFVMAAAGETQTGHYLDIPDGWVAVVTLVFTSVTAGLGFLYKDRANEITRLQGRIQDLERKNMDLEEARLAMYRELVYRGVTLPTPPATTEPKT